MLLLRWQLLTCGCTHSTSLLIGNRQHPDELTSTFTLAVAVLGNFHLRPQVGVLARNLVTRHFSTAGFYQGGTGCRTTLQKHTLLLKPEFLYKVCCRYGPDIGEAASDLSHAAVEGGMTYFTMSRMGVRAVAKRIAKRTAKGLVKNTVTGMRTSRTGPATQGAVR